MEQQTLSSVTIRPITAADEAFKLLEEKLKEH